MSSCVNELFLDIKLVTNGRSSVDNFCGDMNQSRGVFDQHHTFFIAHILYQRAVRKIPKLNKLIGLDSVSMPAFFKFIWSFLPACLAELIDFVIELHEILIRVRAPIFLKLVKVLAECAPLEYLDAPLNVVLLQRKLLQKILEL